MENSGAFSAKLLASTRLGSRKRPRPGKWRQSFRLLVATKKLWAQNGPTFEHTGRARGAIPQNYHRPQRVTQLGAGPTKGTTRE